MAHVAITLEFNQTSKDLALPLNVSTRLLVDSLVESLHLKKPRGQRYALHIKADQGLRSIPLNATLADANILHGMVLMLVLEEQKAAERITKTNASLQTDKGHNFPLVNKISVLGRNDAKSGIFVDVDLKMLVADPKIVSRRHAQIEQDGDHFYLTDLVSTNGTWLNSQRLAPREKSPLWDGDVIEIGQHGLRLTFVDGKKK